MQIDFGTQFVAETLSAGLLFRSVGLMHNGDAVIVLFCDLAFHHSRLRGY
jgi:hypothetical protein